MKTKMRPRIDPTVKRFVTNSVSVLIGLILILATWLEPAVYEPGLKPIITLLFFALIGVHFFTGRHG